MPPGSTGPPEPTGRPEAAGRFPDRATAGAALARKVVALGRQEPVVVALPRGGVPVAVPVAAALGAPLDVVVVRKLGLPGQPELAMGAIGEGGVRVVEKHVVTQAQVTDQVLDAATARARSELDQRLIELRGDRSALAVDGRSVVVVDDGVATGSTALAAAAVLRARGARRLVLAVPVAPADACLDLRQAYDDIVCVHTPEPFGSVGTWYEDFRQLTDGDVRRLLGEAAAS